MNKLSWKQYAITFLVFYLIYRLTRMGLDIFFYHYHDWTGADLSHLTGPIVLGVMIAGIAAWLFVKAKGNRRESAPRRVG